MFAKVKNVTLIKRWSVHQPFVEKFKSLMAEAVTTDLQVFGSFLVAWHQQQLGPEAAQVHVTQQGHALHRRLVGGLNTKQEGRITNKCRAAAPTPQDLNTHHDEKLAGLGAVWDATGSHGFLKVLVGVLTLAPAKQGQFNVNLILT